MICAKNTVHSMSKLCLEAWASKSNETENCFPNSTHDTIGTIYGIWWMVNVFIGFTGNLLTLLAIPYCAIKKKYIILTQWAKNEKKKKNFPSPRGPGSLVLLHSKIIKKIIDYSH